MDALTPRVRELQDWLRTLPSETGAAATRQALVESLRGCFGFEQAAIYRMGVEGTSQRLEFVHASGFSPQRPMEPAFEAYVRSAPPGIFAYDAARPQRRQRNTVWRLSVDAPPGVLETVPLARDVFPQVGLRGKDQMRSLVCEGPRLLAWVGGFRDELFDDAEARAFAALVPHVGARLSLDARLDEARVRAAALDAAMEGLPTAAYLVDASGRVVHANAAGRWALDADGRTLRPRLRRALAGSCADFAVSRVTATGVAPHYLLVRQATARDPAPRLEAFAARHGLTRRQRDVLALLVQGESNRTIGEELSLSLSTVELHVAAVLQKTGVDNRASLVARFWTSGP